MIQFSSLFSIQNKYDTHPITQAHIETTIFAQTHLHTYIHMLAHAHTYNSNVPTKAHHLPCTSAFSFYSEQLQTHSLTYLYHAHKQIHVHTLHKYMHTHKTHIHTHTYTQIKWAHAESAYFRLPHLHFPHIQNNVLAITHSHNHARYARTHLYIHVRKVANTHIQSHTHTHTHTH